MGSWSILSGMDGKLEGFVRVRVRVWEVGRFRLSLPSQTGISDISTSPHSPHLCLPWRAAAAARRGRRRGGQVQRSVAGGS